MAEAVRVDFSGLLAVADELTRNARDVPRLMNVLADALVSEVQETFRQEGAVGGRPKWQGLARSTIAKRRGSTHKILQDRGILAGSITPDTGDSSGQIYAEAYTNVPYAVFHVSPEPRTIIPLRDFFAIDDEHFTAEATEMVLATLVKRRG